MNPGRRSRLLSSNLFRMREVAVLVFALMISPVHASSENEVISAQGNFKVNYTPAVSPIPLNQIHSWTLEVTTFEGVPLEGAIITVTGGMPTHNHGMPTAPVVSTASDKGNYLVEGIRFHMMGDWLITLTIESLAVRDTAEIRLTL